MLTSLYGGNPIEKWFRGSVVLSDQRVIVGEISVYADHHVIMLRTSKGIVTLPAKKLVSFFFYDADVNVNRKYVSRLNEESEFQQYQFFEVVLTGIVTVLREQVIGTQGVDDASDFHYFVLYDNQLIELRKFKKLVFPKITKRSQELLTFVKENHLDPGQSANAIKIIEYFNHSSRENILAMN